jgi:hypothetical protein
MSTNGQLVFTDVDKITFKGVGNTSNAVVDTVTGKIGVGVDNPDANLHVLGNSYVSTNLELGGTLIMGTVNVEAQHSLEAITATGNTTPLTIEFSNATTGIVTTGNVEVGKELTVAGNATVSSNLTVSGNVEVGTANLFVDTTNSRVGIGDAAPAELVHIRGPNPQMLIEGATNENANIDFSSGPSYRNRVHRIQTEHYALSGFATSNKMNFRVNAGGEDTPSIRMTIRGDGNVGIGTSTPEGPLHISKSAPNNGDTGPGILFTRYSNTYGGCIWNESNNNIDGLYFKAFNNSAVSNHYGGTPDMVINSNGRIGIGTTSPSDKFDVRNGSGDNVTTFQVRDAGEIYIGRNHAVSPYISTSMGSGRPAINISSDGGTWRLRKYGSNLDFDWQGSTKGTVMSSGSGQMNFTGQHRTFINDVPFTRADDLEGLIVSTNNNEYIKMSGGIETGSNAITVNESLPVVSLSTVADDKKCFGVISASEDPEKREDFFGNFVSITEKENGDTRVYINSVGEGAVWVTNINGPLESGDYITTSNIAGYGQKQNSDSLKNYTVAKITMDCDFNPVTQPIRVIRKEMGNNVLDEHGQLQWIETSETEKAYKIRYLDTDGNITDEASAVHKAAFVGCTYHCG